MILLLTLTLSRVQVLCFSCSEKESLPSCGFFFGSPCPSLQEPCSQPLPTLLYLFSWLLSSMCIAGVSCRGILCLGRSELCVFQTLLSQSSFPGAFGPPCLLLTSCSVPGGPWLTYLLLCLWPSLPLLSCTFSWSRALTAGLLGNRFLHWRTLSCSSPCCQNLSQRNLMVRRKTLKMRISGLICLFVCLFQFCFFVFVFVLICFLLSFWFLGYNK